MEKAWQATVQMGSQRVGHTQGDLGKDTKMAEHLLAWMTSWNGAYLCQNGLQARKKNLFVEINNNNSK